MIRKYVLGNWKMNGAPAQAVALAETVALCKTPAQVEVVLFPPATLLHTVRQALGDSGVLLGAQDVSPEANGAFTGDISAAMLSDCGCRYVIAGHSERRMGHAESDALVKRKAEAALRAGLIPVICVGESLKERESGDYLKIVSSQVEKSLPETPGPYLIAYEPIWAIGSGRTPTVAQISQVHKTIASVLSYGTSGARAAIAYGGSVKAENARDILSAEGVDGVLVGGASLKAEEFCAIIRAAH